MDADSLCEVPSTSVVAAVDRVGMTSTVVEPCCVTMDTGYLDIHKWIYTCLVVYMYTAIVIIIATTTTAIHSMTTATDTPIATDD